MRVLILFLLLLASCSLTACNRIDQAPGSAANEQMTLEIPNVSWGQPLFDSISARRARAGLNDLRTTVLPPDDIEVRLWYGFGVSEVGGYVLKRENGNWTALSLASDGSIEAGKAVSVTCRSGCAGLWKRLTALGILTLPDYSTLSKSTVLMEDSYYVVELNLNRVYRTYMYPDRAVSHSAEARRIKEITSVLAHELSQ